MKPTFAVIRSATVRPGWTAVRRKVEEFFNAVVPGLHIREDARDELRALEMPTIRKLYRRSGTKMPAKTRVGAGAYGTMIAYEELTTMVERALAGLQRKVRSL